MEEGTTLCTKAFGELSVYSHTFGSLRIQRMYYVRKLSGHSLMGSVSRRIDQSTELNAPWKSRNTKITFVRMALFCHQTDCEDLVRGSKPTSASRLPLSRLGQPGNIPALVLPWGGMAARHRKGVTAEQLLLLLFL
ncbi:hypothetical protein CSKR_106179 [Clonorchis sinensis]|uniref:Uncharacterized protein n=1 Tax=Clonorchis sinensis TaxID=79923 RepID=A0A419PJQ7_CLOSI|nr:hypothetical protein CSKR_106179 [Clonorchis sinensis]